MTKCFEFKLQLPEKTIKTFVYSDTGKDIESRFPGYKVSNIKEIEDPVSEKNLFKILKRRNVLHIQKIKKTKASVVKKNQRNQRNQKSLKKMVQN